MSGDKRREIEKHALLHISICIRRGVASGGAGEFCRLVCRGSLTIDHYYSHTTAAAETARGELRKAGDDVRTSENELANIREHLDIDDGTLHEWASLVDTCIEMTDRECVHSAVLAVSIYVYICLYCLYMSILCKSIAFFFICPAYFPTLCALVIIMYRNYGSFNSLRRYRYKLCLFDKVTQEPLHGGRSTSLGCATNSQPPPLPLAPFHNDELVPLLHSQRTSEVFFAIGLFEL